MYGWSRSSRLNIVYWLVQRLHAGQEVPLFIDQYRTPLYVVQAAEVIQRLIETADVRGTFNLGGGERINRYDFGLRLCDVFGLRKELLKPIEMASTAGLAARPQDCSMNSARIGRLLQITPLTVAEGLGAMRQQHNGRQPGPGC
jgi:dTDP-4-dehydrorhamnose reductase